MNVIARVLVVTILLIAACVLPRAAFAADLLNETFANATTTPGEFSKGGSACLTAGTLGATPPGSLPGCANPSIDAPGVGTLRLTGNGNNDAGDAIYNPVLPSNAGLVVTFDYFAYNGTGADGVGFFFLDGSQAIPTSPGQPGGSLGYAQDCNGRPGILGGYVGLGLDEFGNFSNPADRCKVGGPGFIPNTIAIRGSQASQYRYFTGYKYPPGAGLPIALSKNGSRVRPTPVRVRITLTPSLYVSVELDPTGTGNNFFSYISALSIANINGGAFPSTFRFGWAASTGGSTNIHEIRNVSVQTAPPVLAITKAHVGNFVAGGTGQYTLNIQNVGAVTTSGTTTVTDTLPAGLTYQSASGTGWTCTGSGQTATCTTTQAIPPSSAQTASAFPPITLNVAIAATASGNLVNTAVASGGGAQNQPIATDTVAILRPQLTLTKTHTGSFVVGQPGTFTLTPGNSGGAPTVGPVTITDTLPAGLTFASATGTGWTCSAAGQIVTCTSPNAIAANGTGNPITLTVNVGATAIPSVVNTATATGGNTLKPATASDTVAVTGNPQVTISKVHVGNFVVGQQGTYTLTVGNSGNLPTTGTLTVTDPLPNGLTFVSGTGNGWTCAAAGANVTCTSAAVIAPGATAPPITLVVAIAGNAIPQVVNTATATSPTSPNPATSTDIAPVTGFPQLTITKSHVGDFTVGQNGTYTIAVGNSGLVPTTGAITVTDPLPNGLTYVSASGVGWTCAAVGPSVTCTSSTPIAPSSQGNPITLIVAVGVAAIPSVTNVATAAGGGTTGSVNASDPTTVNGVPALTLTKSHAANFPVGGQGTFTLLVGNNGTAATAGTVTVADTLPAGLTFVSASGPGWTCVGAGQAVSCTSTASIAQGANAPPIALTVAVGAAAIPSAINTATATGGGAPTPANATDTVTIDVPQLGLSKSHAGDFAVGQPGAYTLTVSNTGPVATLGTITVVDPLPAGLTFVSSTGTGWTCAAAGQTVTCTSATPIAAGAAGNPITLNVAVAASAIGTVTNTASATGGLAPNTATATDPTTIRGLANLALAKTHVGDFIVGRNGTYTITPANNGTAATAGTVTVTDPLPNGLTFVSGIGAGWTCAAIGQDVTCTSTTPIAVGANGNPIAITVAVGVAAVPSVTNVATVTGGGATNTATASDVTNVNEPVLAIAKRHVQDFIVGTPGVYSLTVSNTGSAATSGTVTVTDPLPAGLTYVSATGPGWTCAVTANDVVACTSAAVVAPGGVYPAITLTVTVLAAAIPQVVNTASAAGGGAANTANGTDTAPVSGVPGLNITKTHAGNFRVGANGVYTLTVENNGTAATVGPLTVVDTLPTGLTYVSATGPTWTCSAAGQIVTCTSPQAIAPGAAGTPIALTVAVGLAAVPSVINTAAASGGGAPNRPTAQDPTQVDAPQLKLEKRHADDFIVGKPAAFTLIVSNTGAVPTQGTITVSDPLPAGLTYVSATGVGWVCSAVGQNVTCTSATPIAVGATGNPIALNVAVGVGAIPSVTNTATAAGGLAPNIANATDTANVRGLANLALTKTHTGTFNVGQTGTFALTVSNNGTAATSGRITLTDTLPNGLTYVSATGTGWTCSATGQIVTCLSATPIPAGANGNPIALTVNVGAAAAPSATNTASATGGAAENTPTATDEVSVNVPKLALKKSHNGDFAVGVPGTYSLVVTNLGAAPTFGTITVSDPLPNGLTYVSATGTGWTCAATGQTVTCTSTTAIAGGANGNPITLTVNVAAAAAPSVTNTATASGGGSPTGANASDPTNVNAPALNLEKKHSGDFTVGAPGVFTLTVSNKGTSATTGTLTITDPLPNGLTFVSGAGTGWTCSASGALVTCTSTTPIVAGAAGNPITLTVAVASAAIPGVVNIATASGGGTTLPVTARDTVVVAGVPRLTIAKTHTGTFIVGQPAAFALTVGNAGTGATTAPITVVDPLPAGLTYVSAKGTGWTCSASGATVTCTYAATISPSTTAPPITLAVTVLPAAVPKVSNTATASATGTPSVSATDSADVAGAAALSVRKLVNGQPSVQTTAGATVVYTVATTNNGQSTATNVVLTDPLPTGLTPLPASVTINGTSSAGTAAVNGQTLTIPLPNIAAGATVTVTFNATIGSGATTGSTLINVASVGATGVTAAQSNPASVFIGASNIVYDGTTSNFAPINGALVTLADPATGAPLKLAPPGPSPNTNNGNPFTTGTDGRYAFGLTPAQFGAAIRARAAISGGTATYTLTSTATNYLDRKIRASFTPDATGTLYTVSLSALDNQQLAVEGGFTLVNRTVTLSDVLNLLGNIPMFRVGQLQVQKTADRQTATIGDRVVFTLTFENVSTTTLTSARIVDQLPNGLAFAPGTGRVDGAVVAPVVSGRQLVWTLPTLAPGVAHRIVYATSVAPGTQPATLTNIVLVTATQTNGTTVNGQASATVQVIGGVFSNSLTITGRVILEGAPVAHRGVPGVRIFMENGESVLTDAEGRYNFADVRPGLHVLRLDTTSLPDNVRAFDERAYDSPRSTRRLIHGITDTQLLQDVIFIVRGAS